MALALSILSLIIAIGGLIVGYIYATTHRPRLLSTAVLGEPIKAGLGSVFDRPASTAVSAAGNSSKVLVAAGVNGVCGAEVRESTGAAATAWRLRDLNVSGAVLCVLSAPASSIGSPTLPPQGVTVPSGTLFLENISGSGEIVVWTG